MDWHTLFFSTYEIMITVFFSLVTVFVTKKMLDKLLFKPKEGEYPYFQNMAISVFSGTIIICVLLLTNSSNLPAVDVLRTMVAVKGHIAIEMILISFVYFLLLYATAIFLSTMLVIVSVKSYMYATKGIDELAELQKKNIAVAIVMSMAMLAVTISVKPAMGRFISSLIHYESLEEFTEDIEAPMRKHGEMEEAPLKKISPQ